MTDKYDLVNRYVSNRDAYRSRINTIKRGEDISIVDPEIDAAWAGAKSFTSGPKAYYDYFYSGEDIKIFLAETGDDPEFGDLPIHSMGFSVQQNKQPLYGFWNYTYNTMLRGTRIIQGEFTLITKYPGYMKQLLITAAKNRTEGNRQDDYPSPDAWRADDVNLEKYWGRNLDASAKEQGMTEWSIHPPFTLVIAHGLQNASLNSADLNSFYEPYNDDQLLLYDTSERLVEDMDVNHASRIYLDGCELTSVQHGYAPNMMVAEKYTFLAKDIFIPASDWTRSLGVGGTSVNLPSTATHPGTE